MRIGVGAVEAPSAEEASAKAADRVRDLVPTSGYRLSEPEQIKSNGAAP
jgi:hypothetical protein